MIKNTFFLILVAAITLGACNQPSGTDSKQTQSNPEETTQTIQTNDTMDTPQQAPAETPAGQKVKLSTKYGDMTLLLYDETPQHRDNFLKLVREGYYNGTLFHRVIRDFMIQGGDPDSKGAAPGQRLGSGGPGYTIPAEFNPAFIHKKGALSAARQGDQTNPQRRSSGSQFYIVQGRKTDAAELNNVAQQTGAFYTPEQIEIYQTIGGTPFLDTQYTVFGEVISGLDVIDKIAAVPTAPGDRPLEDVPMTMTIIEK
ncbi:MAG: peptidylprolyl isomerase [Clostridia bacterium]|nr:peptidylprolyl isomerase [Clostridia bacterium]